MEIKDYWEERAKSDPSLVTTNDVFLRVLEKERLFNKLSDLGCSSKHFILDVGCGDGETILDLFNKIRANCYGIDYSPAMINLAKKRSLDFGFNPENFSVVDVMDLNSYFRDITFDFILSDRCLINIKNKEQQFKALDILSNLIRPGGYYIAIENFIEGNDRLNQIRKIFGLAPIEIRWHNLYFHESEFIHEINKNFSLIEKINFSSAYYFATRVIYSKICEIEGVMPDYQHPIHRLSVNLPDYGDYSPIIMFVLKKK